MRLFQNHHRKTLAPGPGSGCQRLLAWRARGLGGSGGVPTSTPHPPSQPPAPLQREGGSHQHPGSLPAPWGAMSVPGLRPAPGRGGWVSFWSEGPQKKGAGGGGSQGNPPAETPAARWPCPATSWLGLRGVAVLAFCWHQGWVVPPGSSHRNSTRPAKFFPFSPLSAPPHPPKTLPPFFQREAGLGVAAAGTWGVWISRRPRFWGGERGAGGGLCRSCPRRDGRRKSLRPPESRALSEGREGGFIHPPSVGAPRRVPGGPPGTAGGRGQGTGDSEPWQRDAADKRVARLGLGPP